MTYILPSSGADPQDFTYFNQSMPGAYSRYMYETRICNPLWNTQGCRLSPFTIGQQYPASTDDLPDPNPEESVYLDTQASDQEPDLPWWKRPISSWFSAEGDEDPNEEKVLGGTDPSYLDQVDPCPPGQWHSRNEEDWDEDGISPCVNDPNANTQSSGGLTPAGKIIVPVVIIGVVGLIAVGLYVNYKMFTYSPGAYVAAKSVGALGRIAWDD